MRTFGSPATSPPDYLDELALLLGRAGGEYPKTNSRSDTMYTLTTALVEIEAWLGGLPHPGQANADHRSMLGDIEQALLTRGAHGQRVTPAGEALLQTLNSLTPDSTQHDAEEAVSDLCSFRERLADPRTIVAAFDDLVEALKDGNSRPELIESRLSVLTCVLKLADRSVAQTYSMIAGIADDQEFEIANARHDLDGVDVGITRPMDQTAGLPVDERLQLSRRYLQLPAQTGHHVVWVAYKNARVSNHWRELVGPVEFFDGPTLIEAMKDPQQLPIPLPDELLKPRRDGGLDSDFLFPDEADLRWWAAARIDLGTGSLSDPVRVAREQADAIVQLAIFNRGTSTWEPLGGHVHFIDGNQRSWSGPFYEPTEDEYRAQLNLTADEFMRLAGTVGPHLPVVNPMLRALLTAIGSLNMSVQSSEPELLVQDVRVMELISRYCNQRSWSQFLRDNNAINHAYSEVINGMFNAVSDVLYDETIEVPNRVELRNRIRYYSSERHTSVHDLHEALILLPHLLEVVPLYNARARRLRAMARRLQDVEHLNAWISALIKDCNIKIARAARCRNGLTHGGSGQLEVAQTVRHLINRQVRLAAHTALAAILGGRSVSDPFIELRKSSRDWRRSVTSASNVSAALFDRP